MKTWPSVEHRLQIALMVLLAGCGGAASAQVALDSSEPVTQQVGITPQLGAPLPLDLEFTDASGRTIRLGECFDGRPVILHLVYYECPMLCKLSADGLFSTLGVLSLELGQDFSIVTLSFDPHETPELSRRAREIAIKHCGAEAVERGWRFLTGSEGAIRAVAEAAGFRYVLDEKTGQYAHAAGIFVITPSGTVSRYLSGIEYAPRDLRLAIVEASGGKIGTASDQVLLLCYMYDPTTGKYGFAIMTALRTAGVATVLGMGAGIVIMIRRERRAERERLGLSRRDEPAGSQVGGAAGSQVGGPAGSQVSRPGGLQTET